MPFSVSPTGRERFSALVASLVNSDSKTVTLQGTADLRFDLGLLGQVTLSGIGFKTENLFTGLGGLTDIAYIRLITHSVDSTSKRQIITATLNIKSPSRLSFKVGDVVLDTAGPQGHIIGLTTFADLSLELGDNLVTAVIALDLSLPGAVEFVRGLDTADGTLTLSGFAGSTQNPALRPAIQALRFTVVVPRKFTPVVA